MRVAVITRGTLPINKDSIKGTESWVYNFLRRFPKKNRFKFTLFASGNSRAGVPVYSLQNKAFFFDSLIRNNDYRIFRSTLIASAIKYRPLFDIYHDNTNCGELILPFASFIPRPILVTIHGNLHSDHFKKYFSLYRNINNVYFIPISNAQRKAVNFLNYYKTIYHGIDLKKYIFSSQGGEGGFWAGRAIPEKAPQTTIEVFRRVKQPLFLAVIKEPKHHLWLKEKVLARARNLHFKYVFRFKKRQMVKQYGRSRVLVMPYQWEEPFGLVMIEAMACGTPVIAYARGSVPEIIKDGQTGFIINSSRKDRRGDWIIKKTGVEGLVEAVNRIYKMPKAQYEQMRLNCRKHVEEHFTIDRMVNEYVQTYKEVVADYQKKRLA